MLTSPPLCVRREDSADAQRDLALAHSAARAASNYWITLLRAGASSPLTARPSEPCPPPEQLRRAHLDLRERGDLRPALARRLEREWRAILRCRHRLVCHNQTLVARAARSLRSSGLPFEDLCQEGNLGLMKAAERYDPTRGTRFAPFALQWIRQAMIRALQNQARIVRIPVYTLEQLRRYRKLRAELERTQGAEPGAAQRTVALQMGERRVDELRQLAEPALSLDLRDESGLSPHITALAAEPGDPFQALVAREREDSARRELGHLSRRERQVLHWRFGLDGEDPLSLREIGARLCVSAERARQIEQRALSALRDRFGLTAPGNASATCSQSSAFGPSAPAA